MKIQKSYHRADMRRLTTDSCIKQQGNSLDTHWLWYRKEENGDWVKYGEEVVRKRKNLASGYDKSRLS